MAHLVLERLGKTYRGPVCALRQLTAEVEKDETLVLFGPSGCGKTTTLRLVAGLETPSSGEIFLNGRNIRKVPPWQRDVAFVFQQPVFMPHWSVRQSLAECGDAAAIQDMSERLGICSLMDRKGSDLSGGERQRVAMARAWLRRSQAILLDEPLAHLDVLAKRRLWQELALLRRRFPATIIYVTHDPAEALALADRVAVLLDGNVQQIDSPERLRREPAHRFIAEAFQDPMDPWNFLDPRWDEVRCLGIGSKTVATSTKIAAVAASQLSMEPVGSDHPEAWRVIERERGFRDGLLVCERNRARLMVRSDVSESLKIGQSVMVKRTGQVEHWFVRATGRREEAS